MSKKRWSWKKKLAVSVLVVFFIVVIGFGVLAFYGLMGLLEMTTPRVYAFPSVAELNEAQRNRLDWIQTAFLSPSPIPESARDIHTVAITGLDPIMFATFSLPSWEEARKFAERFAGVPISKFRDGKTSRLYSFNGPTIRRGEHKVPEWWDLKDVKRSIYNEHFGFFMVIDLDTNRLEWKGRIELKQCLVKLGLLLEDLKQVIGEVEAREPEQWLPGLEQLIKDLERSAEESIEWIPLGLE